MYTKRDSRAVRRTGKTYRSKQPGRTAISLISLMLVAGSFIPGAAHASVWSIIVNSIKGNTAEADTLTSVGNAQTVPLLKPAMNIDPSPDIGGGDITIVDDSALVPDEGPSGALSKPKNATISIYVVREGDTLSSIAQLFEVEPSTILWANNLARGSKLKVGQSLTILPVTGVKHTVRKGDTLASIARKYGGEATEIASYNDIDESTLAVGREIIVPNGEIAEVVTPVPAKVKNIAAKIKSTAWSESSAVQGGVSASGYYLSPLSSYIKTQGIHGYNGVDLAGPVGTPVRAAAEGDVIVSRDGGYNGGYGSYIVIQHDNGSQTLYGHLSRVSVSVGDHVQRGQNIGALGNSGRSTGPHLHFEIRNGARNPF